jgi:hypothetical protein
LINLNFSDKLILVWQLKKEEANGYTTASGVIAAEAGFLLSLNLF